MKSHTIVSQWKAEKNDRSRLLYQSRFDEDDNLKNTFILPVPNHVPNTYNWGNGDRD